MIRLLLAALLFWASAPVVWAQIWIPVPIRAPTPSGTGIGTPFVIISNDIGPFNSGSASSGTTVAAPAGSTIVIVLGPFANTGVTIVSVVDSAGNTYALSQAAAVATVFTIAEAYSVNTTFNLPIGGTFTAVVSDASQWFLGNGYAVSGAASGHDISVSINQTTAGTSASLASGTLAQALEILFCTTSLNTGGTFTESAGYTNLYGAGGAGGRGLGYKKTSVTTTSTYGPSWTGSQKYSAACASFKN